MKSLHVDNCPFCEIFSKLKIPYKLYFPKKSEIQTQDDFVIVNFRGIPTVIPTDHVESVSKEQWGRMLYRCKEIFGQSTKLKIINYPIRDHWHAVIIFNKHNVYNLKDLRDE